MANVTITIKGLETPQLILGKAGLAGKTTKVGGIALTKLGKGGALVLAEGGRRELEIEGGRLMVQGKLGGHAISAKGGHALGGHALGGQALGGHALGGHALGGHAVAQSAVGPAKGVGVGVLKVGGGAAGNGTVWSAVSALGLFGPILLVTSLGFIATGIYIYMRNRSVQLDEGNDTAKRAD